MTLMKVNGSKYAFFLSFFLCSCHLCRINTVNDDSISLGERTTYLNEKNEFSVSFPGSCFIVSHCKTIPKSIKASYKRKSIGKIVYLMDTLLKPNIFNIAIYEESGVIDSLNYLQKKSLNNYSYYLQKTPTFISDSIYVLNAFVPIKYNKRIKFVFTNLQAKHLLGVGNSYSKEFFHHVVNSYFFNFLKSKGRLDEELTSLAQSYFKFRSKHQGNYIATTDYLLELGKNISADDRFIYYEFLASEYALSGNINRVKSAIDMQDLEVEFKRAGKKIDDSTRFKTYKQLVSKESFFADLKEVDCVLFNESHFDWRNRYTIISVLKNLKNLGYDNFGFESLFYDTALSKRGYPLQSSGYYLKEPYMGELVRESLKAGFNVFSYEDSTNSSNQREYFQAKNIFNQIKSLNSKTIILAGYGHIVESSDRDSTMFMILKGMAPTMKFMTVDQVRFNDLFYSEDNPLRLPKDSLYFLKSNTLTNYILYNTFSEKAVYDSGINYGIKELLVDIPNDYFLIVYVKVEYDEVAEKAIPILFKRISDLRSDSLNLPPNKYLWQVRDKENNLVKQDFF